MTDLAAQCSLQCARVATRCILAVSVAKAAQAALDGVKIEPHSFLADVWSVVCDVCPDDDIQAIVTAMLAAESPQQALEFVPRPPADYRVGGAHEKARRLCSVTQVSLLLGVRVFCSHRPRIGPSVPTSQAQCVGPCTAS